MSPNDVNVPEHTPLCKSGQFDWMCLGQHSWDKKQHSWEKPLSPDRQQRAEHLLQEAEKRDKTGASASEQLWQLVAGFGFVVLVCLAIMLLLKFLGH